MSTAMTPQANRFRFMAWNIAGKSMGTPFTLQAAIGSRSVNGVDTDGVIYMQSTGLLDKNGKEIYEGDVVETRYGRFLVEWNEWKSGFDPFRGDGNTPDSESESEVIGNAYEHPHLLKP